VEFHTVLMQVLAYAQGWSDVQARASEIGQKRSFVESK
jgi:hypothetical protein